MPVPADVQNLINRRGLRLYSGGSFLTRPARLTDRDGILISNAQVD